MALPGNGTATSTSIAATLRARRYPRLNGATANTTLHRSANRQGVAMRFTPSLLAMPPPSRIVAAPLGDAPSLACRSRTEKAPLKPCASVESASIPRKPISVPTGAASAARCHRAVAATIKVRLPHLGSAAVIPPLVPGGTVRPDQISRGRVRLLTPTEGAQVLLRGSQVAVPADPQCAVDDADAGTDRGSPPLHTLPEVPTVALDRGRWGTRGRRGKPGCSTRRRRPAPAALPSGPAGTSTPTVMPQPRPRGQGPSAPGDEVSAGGHQRRKPRPRSAAFLRLQRGQNRSRAPWGRLPGEP